MRKQEQVTFTNMCMLCDGGRVLVLDRKASDWPGITFPGGHVEEGESFTDAVIREMCEETGLTVAAPRLCGVKDWYDENGRYVVLLYRAERYTGTLRGSDEGEVFWKNLDELPHMELGPDMQDMLRVFLEDELSEFFYRRVGDDWRAELK